MTEEDARKVYTQLYNVYPTKYQVIKSTVSYISDLGTIINTTTDEYISDIEITEMRSTERPPIVSEDINLIDIHDFSKVDFDPYLSFNIQFITGYDSFEFFNVNYMGNGIKISSPTAPIPDGATNTEYTVTLYYMER